MSYARRLFGHCHVSWEITSCCARPYHRKWSVMSPAFLVDGYVQTKWRMILKQNSEMPEEDFDISFHLVRLNHRGDNSRWIDFKVFVVNGSETTEVVEYQRGMDVDSEYIYNFISFPDLETDFIQLHLELIVWMEDEIPEPIADCEDLCVKQLSKDMATIYNANRDFHYDRYIKNSQNDDIHVHRSILYQRIKDPFLKDFLNNNAILNMFDRYSYDALERVFEFFYTANIVPAVKSPLLEIHRLAHRFNIEPIITYYQPDFLEMRTETQDESFELTWTIKGLSPRKEISFRSPTISGRSFDSTFSVRSVIKKTDRGYERVQGGITFAKEMYVCLKLLLLTEGNEHLLVDLHGTFEDGQSCKFDERIPAELLSGIREDQCVTFKLSVSLSTCYFDNRSSLDCSKNICKPHCDQQNYMDLSNDMLSLYETTDFRNSDTPLLKRKEDMLNNHSFIFQARNYNFAQALLNNNISDMSDRIKFDTLDQVLQFLFSGKFSEMLDCNDVFYLYEKAVEHNFDTLRYALESNLKEHLFKNIKDAFSFSVSRNIPDLQTFISERVHMNKI